MKTEESQKVQARKKEGWEKILCSPKPRGYVLWGRTREKKIERAKARFEKERSTRKMKRWQGQNKINDY